MIKFYDALRNWQEGSRSERCALVGQQRCTARDLDPMHIRHNRWVAVIRVHTLTFCSSFARGGVEKRNRNPMLGFIRMVAMEVAPLVKVSDRPFIPHLRRVPPRNGGFAGFRGSGGLSRRRAIGTTQHKVVGPSRLDTRRGELSLLPKTMRNLTKNQTLSRLRSLKKNHQRSIIKKKQPNSNSVGNPSVIK